MASWVLLSDNNFEASPPILFVNTHFDHRGKTARLESAKLIRQRIEKLRLIADRPVVIVTGDFNTAEASAPYQAFLDGHDDLVDTYRVKHKEKGPTEGTFNGFKGTDGGSRIDWILASKSCSVLDAQIDRYEEDGRYPSDHFPVTAVLQLPIVAGKLGYIRRSLKGVGIGRETQTLMMMVKPRLIIEEDDERVLGTSSVTEGVTVDLPSFGRGS
jgi:hypothetical protein